MRRKANWDRSWILKATTCCCVIVSGCNQHPGSVVYKDADNDTIVCEFWTPFDDRQNVDILFVIDNSASMGEEQGLLAGNLNRFVDVLERPDVQANYRIAFVSTDAEHEFCAKAEGGPFRLTSCKDRLEDFVNPSDSVYRKNTACLRGCSLSSEQLTIRETKVSKDNILSSRPWIESWNGATNLSSAEVSIAEALGCLAPQGIVGCEYESPLESMYAALTASDNPESDAFGFLREDAALAIVFVTDAVDCSSQVQYQAEVWDPTNDTFWATPESGVSSAICWNAGVKCVEGPTTGFLECEAQDYRANGHPISSGSLNPRDSVLHPLERYFGLVDHIEARKKDIDPNNEVLVALIGGVHPGGTIYYPRPEFGENAAEEFQEFSHQFGIGWGCQGEAWVEAEFNEVSNAFEPPHRAPQYAAPPVRLAQFAERYAEEPGAGLYPICDSESYGDILESIAESIADQIPSTCYRDCPRTMDPSSPVLVPNCKLWEKGEGLQEKLLSECVYHGIGVEKRYAWDAVRNDYVIPAGQTTCYAMLVDQNNQTPDPHDDLSFDCQEQGLVLEFTIVRDSGIENWNSNHRVFSKCDISSQKQVDCPGFELARRSAKRLGRWGSRE